LFLGLAVNGFLQCSTTIRVADLAALRQQVVSTHRAVAYQRCQEEQRLLTGEMRTLQIEVGRLTRGADARTSALARMRAHTGEVDRLADAIAGAAASIREQLSSRAQSSALPPLSLGERHRPPAPANSKLQRRPPAAPAPATSMFGRLQELRQAAEALRAAAEQRAQTSTSAPPLPPPLDALEAIRASLDELRPVPLAASLPDHDCAICIESLLRGQSAVTLPCNHVFHGGCILKWITRGSACCPLCKQPCKQPVGEVAAAAPSTPRTHSRVGARGPCNVDAPAPRSAGPQPLSQQQRWDKGRGWRRPRRSIGGRGKERGVPGSPRRWGGCCKLATRRSRPCRGGRRRYSIGQPAR